MSKKCLEAEILERALLNKVFNTIEKIKDSDEYFKKLSCLSSRQIAECILYIFLIRAFYIGQNYNNKSENKIINELIMNLNFDIERVDELTEQALYFLNHLVSKNILIKTKKKDINYYKLNKDYIETIEKQEEN